ncbi:MAG: hypothetical protein K8T91_05815 [Planctomycetes bacterium]|nr:hypothetical protein [Planctomycetota bacterium]
MTFRACVAILLLLIACPRAFATKFQITDLNNIELVEADVTVSHRPEDGGGRINGGKAGLQGIYDAGDLPANEFLVVTASWESKDRSRQLTGTVEIQRTSARWNPQYPIAIGRPPISTIGGDLRGFWRRAEVEKIVDRKVARHVPGPGGGQWVYETQIDRQRQIVLEKITNLAVAAANNQSVEMDIGGRRLIVETWATRRREISPGVFQLSFVADRWYWLEDIPKRCGCH